MIYFDMDGVLAVYDYDAYSPDKTPMWNESGSHYFSRCKVDNFAKEIVISLARYIGEDMYILTSVSGNTSEARNEQIFDKMKWIEKNYPILNLCNFIACESDKRNTIAKIKGFKLSKADILIDDYNKNLYAWNSSGGTAIKYVNGINSVGQWPGLHIKNSEDVNDAVKLILETWYHASK